MCTAPLAHLHALVTGHQMSAPRGFPKVNKFEQVSGFGHKISLAGGHEQKGVRAWAEA